MADQILINLVKLCHVIAALQTEYMKLRQYGLRTMGHGVCSVQYGVRSTKCGLWSVAYVVWRVVCGVWGMGYHGVS